MKKSRNQMREQIEAIRKGRGILSSGKMDLRDHKREELLLEERRVL